MKFSFLFTAYKIRCVSIMIVALGIFLLSGCSEEKFEKKGFSLTEESEDEDDAGNEGVEKDSLIMKTRPGSVLLTGLPEFRLTPIYKLNYNKKKTKSFIGSNRFYRSYSDLGESEGNNWHYNYLPGLEAVYGYNMVNISHYNVKTQKQKEFFKSPVLVKTLYYPSFTKDTLNFSPVNRNYYMVSVYDEDTNKDRFINEQDLRRFYLFDINADNPKPLVLKNYSVLSSEYDSVNDFMYVYAQLDKNENGSRDEGEDVHIFWIDLKNPQNTGRHYYNP